MRLAVTPQEVDVAIGEPVVLQLEVYNSRPVIDGYRASLVGVEDVALTCEPPELSLFPETGGLMVVSFTLPPGFAAGPRVIGVRVASMIDPSVTAVEEVLLRVAPLQVVTLTVEPLAVTAGRRADFTVALENRGNVAVDAPLGASDSTGTLGFELSPPRLAVGPGEVGRARVSAVGRRPLFGSPVPHQLSFTAEVSPEPLVASGTFLQKPLVPRGVLTLLSILAAIALWGAVLLLGVNQAVDRVTGADQGEDAALAAGPVGGGMLGSVAGTVLASPDAEGATVSLIPLPGPEGAPAPQAPEPVTTPASGVYVIENVTAPATYQIVFAKQGLGTQSRLVELKLGEALSGVDVRLVGGSGAISGMVSDGTDPIGAATVTATNGTDTITTLTSPTGPVGSYALAGLPTPATYVVAFEKAGFGTKTMVLDLAAGQRLSGQDVVMSKGKGSISGTVFTQAGAPLADVSVTVTEGTGAVPALTVTGGSATGGTTTTTLTAPATTTTTRPPAPVLAATTTLAQGPVGFFTLSGLPTPATFTVTFQKQGFLVNTATVVLAENGNETALNPLMQPVTGAVAGVVNEDVRRVGGCPPGACRLAGAIVRVTDRNGKEVRTTNSATSPAEALGRYEIAGLTGGLYTVTFSKEGYVPQTFSLSLTDDEQRALDVTLKGEPGVLSGTAGNCSAVAVLLQDNSALSPAVGVAPRPDASWRIGRIDTPGEYRVVFFSGASPVDFVDVDLGPGKSLSGVNGFCPVPTTLCSGLGCLLTPTTTMPETPPTSFFPTGPPTT